LKYYQFVLKQFLASTIARFKKEKQMSQALKNHDGTVQYFGWFQSTFSGSNGPVEYYNLVLERADMDLYEAIRTRSPPGSPDEILGLWETMKDISIALASIHNLEVDNLPYHM
jgi:hypothetical protein